DDLLPKGLQRTNRFGVPMPILMLQGIIGSILTLAFLLLPSVKSSYWALTAMAAQLAFVMYAILFLSAIRLRYTAKDMPRPYTIPGGNIGIWLVGGSGFIISLFVIFLGFVPPSDLNVGSIWRYEALLL